MTGTSDSSVPRAEGHFRTMSEVVILGFATN